ncbi:MAG: hypothetical protein ACJ72N_18710 [Labedaea sp.]
MDESPADGAALLRRTMRRTLIVLGGSVAGTAIAVAISSASASADPRCPAAQPAAPGLAEPSVAGELLAVRPTQQACEVERMLPAQGVTDLGAWPARLADDLGGGLAENLRDDLADQIGQAPRVLVDLGGLDQGAGAAGVLGPAGAPSESAVLAPPAGAPSATPEASAPGEPVDASAGLIRHGSPAPGSPAPWVLPNPPRLPVAQPAAPSGGAGHAGGGGDSPVFALPVSAGRCGLVRVPAPPATEPRLIAAPRRAPGVSPD